MSEDGLISVVVPVYDVESYIEQCVDSLLSQTHEKIEIILVNDGSPDRSGKICDSFATLDRRIRVVHKPNGGLVSARKAGVAVATGEYLGFVDGDDWIGNDFFEFLYEHAASASADLAISGHVREFFGKQEVIPPRSAVGIYDRERIVETVLPTAIYNGVFFQHGVSTYVWNKLFRRKEAKRLLLEVDENIVMGEDSALTYPYLASSERMVVCGPGRYFYRQRSNSIVKSVQNLQREYYQLGALFRYLKRKLAGFSYSSTIFDQLRYYFYAQVLIRSGAVVGLPGRNMDYLVAFPELSADQRVVVYSSGSFGQHVVGAIQRLNRFELVGWIDEDDHESQRCGLPVSSLDSLSGLDFDLILIAAIDSEYSESLARRLQRKGIHRAKISVLNPNFERLDERLRETGFDVDSFHFSGSGRMSELQESAENF